MMARARTTAVGLMAALALAACAPTTYAGIPLRAGAGDPELQQLARQAQAGDKQAQLELGIRYEEGRGVARNLARAEELYELAASVTAGRQHVYAPPVGNQTAGQVMDVAVGTPRPGLQAARWRLERLRNTSPVSTE